MYLFSKKKKIPVDNTHNMTKHIHYFNVEKKWADLIMNGLKTKEGRLNKEKFQNLKVGDLICWNNNFHSKIKALRTYPNFYLFLKEENLETCLPGVLSLDEGVECVYYKYYSKEDENKYGVLCIEVDGVVYV